MWTNTSGAPSPAREEAEAADAVEPLHLEPLELAGRLHHHMGARRRHLRPDAAPSTSSIERMRKACNPPGRFSASTTSARPRRPSGSRRAGGR